MAVLADVILMTMPFTLGEVGPGRATFRAGMELYL